MTIELDEPRNVRLPVYKREEIGLSLIGMLIRKEQRDVLRTDDAGQSVKDTNPKTGKPRQELVLTLMTMAGTTMPAGLGDDIDVLAPGECGRLIIKGKAFAEYISAMRELDDGKANVGDVITLDTDTAIIYDASGTPGATLTDQTAVGNARMKGKTVGVYGTLHVRRARDNETTLVTKAEALHNAAKAPTVLDDEPF